RGVYAWHRSKVGFWYIGIGIRRNDDLYAAIGTSTPVVQLHLAPPTIRFAVYLTTLLRYTEVVNQANRTLRSNCETCRPTNPSDLSRVQVATSEVWATHRSALDKHRFSHRLWYNPRHSTSWACLAIIPENHKVYSL